MKLPNLQQNKLNGWLEALKALRPNSPKQRDAIVQDLDSLLELMTLQAAGADTVTASHISACLHLYLKILTSCLVMTGGYEYTATKEQYKIIAKVMLSHLRIPTRGWETVRQNRKAISQQLHHDLSARDKRLWPGVKAVCKPFYETAMRDFATLANDHIHFSEDDYIAMVFHPMTNALQFLTKVTPVDGGDSLQNFDLNNENKDKRPLKIFMPVQQEVQSDDAADGEASSAAAAKKPAPIVGVVSDGRLPAEIAVNNIIDINLQKLSGGGTPFRLCFHRRDGALSVIKDDTDGFTIPQSDGARTQNYFYHPSQPVVFVLSGDKTITVKIAQGENTENHIIPSDAFPCAVKQIVVSPDGNSVVVLLANGMFVPCNVAELNIQTGLVCSSANINFIANKIQWLSNECFILLNEGGYSEVYTIEANEPKATLIEAHKISSLHAACFMPFHDSTCDLGRGVKIDRELVRGVVVYNGPEGTTLALYRVQDGKIKFFQPSSSQNKSHAKSEIPHHIRNKTPVGITLAANNRYVAIRYADYSIDVVDLRILLPKAAALGIFKQATKSISSYGEYTGGYCAA